MILPTDEAQVIKMARALRGLSQADLDDIDKRRSTYLRAGVSSASLQPQLDARAVNYHKTWREQIAKLKA